VIRRRGAGDRYAACSRLFFLNIFFPEKRFGEFQSAVRFFARNQLSVGAEGRGEGARGGGRQERLFGCEEDDRDVRAAYGFSDSAQLRGCGVRRFRLSSSQVMFVMSVATLS
jgi:hypothetical protein